MNLYKYSIGGFERHVLATSFNDAEKVLCKKHPGKKIAWICEAEKDVFSILTFAMIVDFIKNWFKQQ